MNFNSMVSFICNKVSKTDTFSQARCLEYVLARHKMIYESFDWKAAQLLVTKTINAGAGTTTTINVPEVHHVLSVRLDGKLLDPVTPSFIFDQESTETDEYLTAGTPKYYEEFLDMSTQTRSLRFFPPLADNAANHSLVILGKTPYNESWTQPAIPSTENGLMALATGDMWEYLHEVGKAQVKFQEGATIIAAAQQQDTPGSQRPRQTRRLTANGNSLIELTDNVCMLTNDFTPEARNMVKECIRRCYQQVWNAAPWPETMVVDSPTVVNGIAIASHLIDKVVSVRANLSTNVIQKSYAMLEYDDSSVILGLTPEAFSEDGTPLSYNLMLPVGLPYVFPSVVQVQFKFTGSESQKVFVRGEASGVEISETLTVGSSLVATAFAYDVIHSITKPVSTYSLQVLDMSSVVIMSLRSNEHSRKYNRIQVLPDYDTTQYPDRVIFVLGKRTLPQLLDDFDGTVLTGIENILINAAAADVFAMQSKLEQSASFKAKADAAMQSLISRETQQQGYHPRILPYTEPDASIIAGL